MEALVKQLKGICIITQEIAPLRDFYQTVLQLSGEGDDTYTAFSVGGITLSLFTVRDMERMAPGSMKGAGRGNCTLEFEVDDVDLEFERLTKLDVPIVKLPTTQPWGLRSVWFRDPDGNIVNFFAPVRSEEMQ
jgi:catechol 2,3-dioxygenase-like lactoylglutathione lyase family enzyme